MWRKSREAGKISTPNKRALRGCPDTTVSWFRTRERWGRRVVGGHNIIRRREIRVCFITTVLTRPLDVTGSSSVKLWVHTNEEHVIRLVDMSTITGLGFSWYFFRLECFKVIRYDFFLIRWRKINFHFSCQVNSLMVLSLIIKVMFNIKCLWKTNYWS